METPLDHPVWHALTGRHAPFAVACGQARHYIREIAPFSGIAEPSATAYADLAVDLAPGTEARLFSARDYPPPAGWETISARPIVQMTFARPNVAGSEEFDARIGVLGLPDVPDMLALVDAAKPGPFGARTVELGTYVGVRDNRTSRLIAMGGERFRVAGYVELGDVIFDKPTHQVRRCRAFFPKHISPMSGRPSRG